MKVPFIVHAAHSSHGFNAADMSLEASNRAIFNESRVFADTLKAPYIIVHPGILGSHETAKNQISLFKDSRILIENKPFLAVDEKSLCCGASPQDVKDLMTATSSGLCYDINHSFNYAKHKNMDYLTVVKAFAELGPSVAHVCGIGSSYDVDEHLHLREGDIDLAGILEALAPASIEYWTLETPKARERDLDDFIEDSLLLKDLLRNGGKK
jgi:sugar phosphate isomerase/epimerase